MFTFDESKFRQDLESYSKGVDEKSFAKWKPDLWLHIVAVAAGLDPFSDTVQQITPPTLRAFVPRASFKPSIKDRKNAIAAFRNGIALINAAIVETTKHVYAMMPGSAENFDVVLKTIENDLMDSEKRAHYFSMGAAMMGSEELWTGRHQLLGVIVLEELQEKSSLTDEEFTAAATRAGLLEDGKPTYDPMAKEPPKQNAVDFLKNMLGG